MDPARQRPSPRADRMSRPRRVSTRERRIVRGFPRIKLAVAGDLIADEFIYGRLDRVSREAPVLILRYDSTEIVPGGAGNAAANAQALGAQVTVVGVVGRDEAGRRLQEALPRMNRDGVVCASGYVTPIKTRILAGGVHSAKQQVVRIDRAGGQAGPAAMREFDRLLARTVGRADAVILSDYGTGLLTPERWARVVTDARRRAPALVFVDSRYHLDGFEGMTAEA